MSTSFRTLWTIVQTGGFWTALLADDPRLGARSRHRGRPRHPASGSCSARATCGRRVPRSDRVPAADPIRGADPAARPDARHEREERGVPRRVRSLLAAARADDVRRARRRPARARHRALVRRRDVRAARADHAAELRSVHRDRPAHRVHRRADPRVHGRALPRHPRARAEDELRAGVRPQRRSSTRSRSRSASSASAIHIAFTTHRAARAALASVAAETRA